jgi:hypothetical protein
MKSVIYYTDNELEEPLNSIVQIYIYESRLPITSASLMPIRFGKNAVIEGKRSYPTMVKQIISCLERSTSKYVFFCEHDVLYHPSHFEFTPPRDYIFYYNTNVWRWLLGSETAMRYDRMIPLSSMCANRELALEHYRLRARKIKENGWDKINNGDPLWVRKMGYEPGTKKKRRGGITDDDFDTWDSNLPIIDIRHGGTFSPTKIKIEDFKHKPKWWMETIIEEIPGWDLKKLFNL